ncbi:MAG: MFS transporter [Candidatus Woykebacteria bacterium GWB1_45_5]|uniref:MFS transporter n=2 Tax=Candidatus Woykeibacteriota TaxID=1817899 RepID=A0A1G1W482_9BACT|nr:MAG: MFS transporter [Candidatus Woykebacteria bacterium GWA1_44_8]OGY24560.1 MAG: MFS transporter [Candidatus Woykebacteria bacterium GWB1_45_5]
MKIFGISKNVFFLGLVSLLNDASSEMIYPLVPLFLTQVLGASLATVGIIEGIAESTAAILKTFSGWLSDKIGRRKGLTVVGYSLSAVSKPILSVATSPLHVLLVRFSDRVGKGIRTAPRDALVSFSSSSKELGKSFGFHRALDNLGATIGPLLAFGLLFLLNNNFRLIFLLSFVASALAIAVLIIFVKEVELKKEKAKAPKISWQLFPARFYIFLVAIAIFSLGNSSDAFLILRARDLGMALFLIPVVYAFFNLVYSIFSTPFGVLSDKIGRRKTLGFGLLIFSLVYLGFGAANKAILIWPLFALYGVYAAATEGVLRAFTADLVGEKIRGTAYGLLNGTIGTALLPASAVAGFLWDRVNPSAPFYYGAALALAALLVLLFLPSQPTRKVASP